MKPHGLMVSFFLVVACAMASDGPWLEAPDGFAWPQDAEAQPEDDREIEVTELPGKIREYLSNQYEEGMPSKIYFRRADLNDDGVQEWFLDRPERWGLILPEKWEPMTESSSEQETSLAFPP